MLLGPAELVKPLFHERRMLGGACTNAALAAAMALEGMATREASGAIQYDEVAEYTLPRLLTTTDGAAVASADAWYSQRRAEVQELVEEQMMGVGPPLQLPCATCTSHALPTKSPVQWQSSAAKRPRSLPSHSPCCAQSTAPQPVGVSTAPESLIPLDDSDLEDF